ncbi:HNH endonuclease signature motif containing protein [Phycicoccus jejuensis]|uniref:HNH endonuclease signature motif containing protein n=1 Tax=Phycicoccus jejuensis TaxID=367299 RepID=UPI0004C3E128|nr:HNH endonuclease signature motif containing protein [Phycicoccus jejuensis]
MDTETLSRRVAGLREECARLGRELVEQGHGLSSEEAFALAGAAQGMANAADAVVAVAGAWGARVETTVRSGSWERVHPVGFVDAMASTRMSLATGLTEGVAGRKAALGAALGERFPRVRDLLIEGAVATANVQKVVDACAGLDVEACVRVDADLAPRLAAMDPARVAGEARRVATRVAADQVAAHVALRKRGRCVEVRPGEDGLTDWFASLPTATSSAMWAAVEELAGDYRQVDEALSVPESRADALADLVLRNVKVSAQVTLGVPVVTDRPAPEQASGTWFRVECDDDETLIDSTTGEVVRYGDLDPDSREELSWLEEPAELDGDLSVSQAVVSPGYAVSGTQLPGLGWVDPATLANLLKVLPFEVARAVLEADTGTLASLTTGAYKPPKAISEFVKTRDGTCRMWGCTRPAVHCDLDHVKPWPVGATTPTGLEDLCRRHHRFKQQGRWRPTLAPDGTVTWHGPDGATRTTGPQHRLPNPLDHP